MSQADGVSGRRLPRPQEQAISAVGNPISSRMLKIKVRTSIPKVGTSLPEGLKHTVPTLPTYLKM